MIQATSFENPETHCFWMPPHIRICITNTGTVVLDMQRNRYLALGDKEAQALLALDAEGYPVNVIQLLSEPMDVIALPDALRIAHRLVKAGLLSCKAQDAAPWKTVPLQPELTLTSIGYEVGLRIKLRPVDFVLFMRAYQWARKAIAKRTLYSIACEIGTAKSAVSVHFETQRAIARVSAFRRLRPLMFTERDQCLLHALALTQFLAYDEIYPTWIIGVRARPWSAHSWVQAGRWLLDAKPEHVCDYSPILTV